MIKNILLLIRPHQWLKNGFVFIPLFFHGDILNLDLLRMNAISFFSFCFMASSIYCLNDYCDADTDKHHPTKCRRPIACGAITKLTALLIMAVCIVVSIMIAYILPYQERSYLQVVVGTYLLINIGYCLKLKQKPILDVFILSVGFVLRIFAGSLGVIPLSHWIVLLSFLLALFLAFAKRRDDVVIYENTGTIVRKNIKRYNLEFMNQVIGILASITMVCYILYTVSPEVTERLHTDYLYLTSIFVLAGIIRYLQISIVDVRSGSPTKVLMKDHFIQLCIVGWIAAFAFIIYLR